MDDFELEQLERDLRSLGAVAAPGGLRRRVLRSVTAELGRERSTNWLTYAVAAAAVFVLWINLSWSATRPMLHAIQSRTSPAADTRSELCQQLQELLPELTPAEAEQQAHWMQLNTNLPHVSPRAAALGIRPF